MNENGADHLKEEPISKSPDLFHLIRHLCSSEAEGEVLVDI